MRAWFSNHKVGILYTAVFAILALTVMGCCCNGSVLVLLLGSK